MGNGAGTMIEVEYEKFDRKYWVCRIKFIRKR